MGMDYSLVQRIIDGLGKILDTKPGSPDEGTYVTEQQLADWIKGQTVVPAYYYNGVMYSDALHTTPITGQAGALYIDQDNNVLYRWDGAAWDAMSDEQLRQDILDGTVVAKKAECDEDGNNIKATYATKVEAATLQSQVDNLDHRLENIEQSKGDYIVASYKDGSITPSGKGAWAVVEGLRGVSRVANNLFKTSASKTSNGVTATYDSTTRVVTLSGEINNYYASIFDVIPKIDGHTYLLFASSVVNPNNASLSIGCLNNNLITPIGSPTLAVSSASTYNTWGIVVPSSGVDLTGISFVFDIVDISVYFAGDTSVNVSSLTIADIQKNYPHLLIPTEYGTRIVDWTGNGVRAWARNLAQTNPTFFDSPYIPTFDADKCYKVTAGVTYYWKIFEKTFTTYRARLFFYDMEGNPLTTPSTSWVTEVSSNGFYVNGQGLLWGGNASDTTKKWTFSQDFYILFVFTLGDTSASSVISKFCFNVTDANDGTYTPYHAPNTLSFPSTSLKSAGSVRDTLELNVEVDGVAKKRETQRIEGVDLGTDVSFQYDSSANRFYSTSLSATIGGETVSGRYKNTMLGSGMYELSMTGADKTYFVYASNKILYIYDNSKTASDLVSGKAPWLVGIKLYYELATPVVTLSDPLIDNTLLTESGGRMSTVQTGTVVDGSFDLGFITL